MTHDSSTIKDRKDAIQSLFEKTITDDMTDDAFLSESGPLS